MADKFTPPTTCRICEGTMEVGTLRTTRESYRVIEDYPFEQVSTAELWYKLEPKGNGKFGLKNPEGGPLMVLHYRCVDCGYLESYAQGNYPQK